MNAYSLEAARFAAGAGFDGHRLDLMAQLALTSRDYGDLAKKLVAMVAPGRLRADDVIAAVRAHHGLH